MKRCSYCQELKPLLEFNLRKASIDGRAYRCKVCHHYGRIKPFKNSQSPEYKKYRHVHPRFNITIEEYKLYISKGCQICGTTDGKLVLDHDHETNMIRDCLCHNCNTALGLFKDDIKRLENSISYLRKHSGPKPENLE